MSSNVGSVTVGVTGASGVLYAVRTMAALLSIGVRVEVVVSDIGRRLLQEELGVQTDHGQLESYLVDRYGVNITRDLFVLHSNKNVGASIASGSYLCDAMVIVPCSMKTLAGVAHGSSTNLIERAADVFLKERRRLVVARLLDRQLRMQRVGKAIAKFAKAGGSWQGCATRFFGR